MSKQICENCGNQFIPFNSKQRFCSVICRSKIMPPPKRGSSVEKKCEHCSKIFKVKMARDIKSNVRFCSMDCRIKAGAMGYKKENHPNWKGGITKYNRSLRHTKEYDEWRFSVYKRDNYTCQKCDTKCTKKTIVAHHIKFFNDYPELRYKVSNGITLCRSCHKKLHKEIGEDTQFKKVKL